MSQARLLQPMTELPDRYAASPFVTLWLRPRQTIERIVATQPRHLVLVLAALGMIAGLDGQMERLSGPTPSEPWFWFGLVVGGAVFGIISAFSRRGTAELDGGAVAAVTRGEARCRRRSA